MLITQPTSQDLWERKVFRCGCMLYEERHGGPVLVFERCDKHTKLSARDFIARLLREWDSLGNNPTGG